MGSQEIDAGGAVVRIDANLSLFDAGVDAAEKRLQQFAANAVAIGKRLALLGVGLGGGLLGIGKSSASAGEALLKISRATGASSENLTELGHAAKSVNVNVSDLESGLMELSKNGFNPAKFDQYADQIAGLGTHQERLTQAQQLFGASGAKLLPLLKLGSAGLAKMRAEAQSLGLVLSTKDVTASAKLSAEFSMLSGAVGMLTTKFGATLSPTLSKVIRYVTELIGKAIAFVEANKSLGPQITIIVTALTVAGAAIAALGTAFYVAGPLIRLAMIGAAIATLAFKAAMLVAGTSAAIMAATLRVLSVTTYLGTAAVYAFNLAMKVAAATAGVLWAAVKTVTAVVAIQTLIWGLAAVGLKNMSLILKSVVMWHRAFAVASIASSAAVYLLIGAVVALGAGLLILAGMFAGDALWKSITDAFDSIQPAISGVLSWIGSQVQELAASLAPYFGEVGAMFAGVFDAVAETAKRAFSNAAKFFGDIYRTGVDTFQGISDALAAGDIELAMKVLWAGLKVAWTQGGDFLRMTWDSTLIYLEGSFDNVLTTLKDMWDIAVQYIIGAIDKVMTKTRDTFQNAQDTIAQWLARLTGVDVDVLKEDQNARNARQKKGDDQRIQDRNAKIAGADGTQGFNQRAAEREARLAGLGAASPELAQQQAELQALLKQSREAAEQVVKEREDAGNAGYEAAKMASAGAQSTAAQTRNSSGAASTVARLLNGNRDPAQQQVDELKKLNDKQKEQAKLLNKIAGKESLNVKVVS